MKKVMSILVALVVLAGICIAGMEANKKDSFVLTGDAGSTTIDKGNGTIINTQMSVYFPTNKTISIYRASIDTKEAVAEVAGTAVELYTSASNKVEGYTVTTNDYLLFHNDTSGWQLSKVSAIGLYTSASQKTAYTTAGNVTVDLNDPVYICKSGDILEYAGVETNALQRIEDAFTSKGENPVHIAVASGSGSATRITGTYSIED